MYEERAEQELRCRGYVILARNYRGPGFEIDLVARHQGYVVFIEVRARGRGRLGHPAETVDRRKRFRIVQGARHYTARYGLVDAPIRFDVVTFAWGPAGPILQVFPDAFRPGE